MKTAWMLIVIDSDGSIEHIMTDDLDAILHPEQAAIWQIAGDDDDIARGILEDLSRVGARYCEFIGGTVVLAAVEQ